MLDHTHLRVALKAAEASNVEEFQVVTRSPRHDADCSVRLFRRIYRRLHEHTDRMQR